MNRQLPRAESQDRVLPCPTVRGSHRTGPNTIAFPGRQITVAVPGERHARDLRTTPEPLAAMNCDYGNFCAAMDGDPTQ